MSFIPASGRGTLVARRPQSNQATHTVAKFSPAELVLESLRNVPSTRFYGSKRKLLPWIYSNIGHLKFETALDLFGGTASVSLLLKIMGKLVSYNDGFKFNEDVGRTLLQSRPALSRLEIISFIENVRPTNGLVSRLFEGVFYTDEENAWIDGFAMMIETALMSNDQKALLRYLFYQACLKKRPFNLFHRSNLHLRMNNSIRRSFGNMAIWQKGLGIIPLTTVSDKPTFRGKEKANAPPHQQRSALFSPRVFRAVSDRG